MSDETADLAEWKRQAIEVLAAWDRVFTALGEPGPLGGSKAANALAEVERRSAENERLREALRIAHYEIPMCACRQGLSERCEFAAALDAASLSETGGEAE